MAGSRAGAGCNVIDARRLVHMYGLAGLAALLALAPLVAFRQSSAASCILLFLGATIFAGRLGGFGPGVCASLVGGLAAYILVFSSGYAPGEAALVTAAQLALCLLASAAMPWVNAHVGMSELRWRHRMALMEVMLEDPGEGVLSLDPHGRIASCNPAAARMLGRRQSDLIGLGAHDVVHPAGGDLCAAECSLRGMPAADERFRADAVFTCRDGQLAVTYSLSPLIFEGSVGGAVLAFQDVSERQRALEALRDSEERYRTVVETSPDSIILTDLYGYIAVANHRTAEMYGYGHPDELIGMSMVELVAPADRPRSVLDKRAALKSGTVRTVERSALRKDGICFPVEVSSSVVVDEGQRPRALVTVARDISDRKRAEAALRLTQSRVHTQQAVTALLARSSTLSEAAGAMLEMLGTSEGWAAAAYWTVVQQRTALVCTAFWHDEALQSGGFKRATTALTLPRGVDLAGRVWQTARPIWLEEVLEDPRFQRVLAASGEGLRSAVCVPVFEGNEVHSVIELFGRELRPRDEDALRMLTSVGTQIGLFIERRQAERALEHRALHDLLTDLPNRGLLQQRLARAVPMARGGSSLALLLMDLDRFKEVNDTFGHHYGDFLLQEVADRLRASTDDSATVARLGGDEFAVLLPRTTESQATSVAVRIAGALRQPVVIQGHSLDIGVSIGIALCPQQADDPESLMQRADIAMYAAKRTRAGYAVYAPEHDQHNPLHLALAADLRQAIEGGLLVLHYQPKINLNTCEIGSVEALARWHHPVHGSIPPQEFIPLAEQTGLIIPLTHWVLEASIRQCRRWQDEGIRLRVAMNLSAQNLQDHDLPALVTRLLNTHGVDPHCLQLEVTESAIMIDSSRALQALQELHEAGVDISIDDFGTGYSSLTRLRRLPVRQIKIDKSFVLEMARSEDDAFIARSVIDLGHNLGLEVVAEGVSDGEIWDLLRGMGCDVAQGFYVSHPLPAGELTTWLQASAPSLEALLQARGQDRRGRRGWAGA